MDDVTRNTCYKSLLDIPAIPMFLCMLCLGRLYCWGGRHAHFPVAVFENIRLGGRRVRVVVDKMIKLKKNRDAERDSNS